MTSITTYSALTIFLHLFSASSHADTKFVKTNTESIKANIESIKNICITKSQREIYHKIRRTINPPKSFAANNTTAYEYYLRARCFRLQHIDTIISKKPVSSQARALYSLALKWYEKAAILGHIPSHSIAATMHLSVRYGKGKAKFLEYIQRAANLNASSAQLRLARVYFFGRHNIKRDINKSKYWLQRAVKNKNSYAIKWLGDLYLRGSHPYPRDINKAIFYYKKSFQLNKNRTAAIMMGLIHYNGIGVSKNRMQSKKWFLRANVNTRIFFDGNCLSVFAHRSGVAKKDLNFYNKTKLKDINIIETRCFNREKNLLASIQKKQ